MNGLTSSFTPGTGLVGLAAADTSSIASPTLRRAKTDAGQAELDELRALAVHAINEHVNDSGLCRVCGAAWPCVTCQRADFALGAT